MNDEHAEYFRLIKLNERLTSALEEVRAQMALLSPVEFNGAPYRIALRPDQYGADPFDIKTLCDDIVVSDVSMFRAEQMSKSNWWVACYLDKDTSQEITWSVTARSKPLRIEWVTTDFPSGVVYEHECPDSQGH